MRNLELCEVSEKWLKLSRMHWLVDLPQINLYKLDPSLHSKVILWVWKMQVTKTSPCCTCRNVNQSIRFWYEKHDWHFLLFYVLHIQSSQNKTWFPPKLPWGVLSPTSKKIICVQCIDVMSNIAKSQKLFHLVMSPGHKHRIICCSLEKSESYM